MYKLSEKKKRKGWKEHVPGDPMPVESNQKVKVRFGEGSKCNGHGREFEWRLIVGNYSESLQGAEIVAYKVIEPKEKSRFGWGEPTSSTDVVFAGDDEPPVIGKCMIGQKKVSICRVEICDIPGGKPFKIMETEEVVGNNTLKTYKLREMWKVWKKDTFRYGGENAWCIVTEVYSHLEYAKLSVSQEQEMDGLEVLAITRADATEFYEGEGLD